MNLGLYKQIIYILPSSEETQPGGGHCIAHNAFLRTHLKGSESCSLHKIIHRDAVVWVEKGRKQIRQTYDDKLTNGGCDRAWACELLVLWQKYKYIQFCKKQRGQKGKF